MNFTKIENKKRVLIPEIEDGFDLWLNLAKFLRECNFEVKEGHERLYAELEHIFIDSYMFNSEVIFLNLKNKDKVVFSTMFSTIKKLWDIKGYPYTGKEMASHLLFRIREEWNQK